MRVVQVVCYLCKLFCVLRVLHVLRNLCATGALPVFCLGAKSCAHVCPLSTHAVPPHLACVCLPPHSSQRQNDTPPPAVVSAVVPTEPSGRASPEGCVCHHPAALRAACCRGLPPVVQRRAPGTRTHLSHTPVLYSHTPLPPAFLYSSPRLWCCPWPLSRVFPALFVLAHTHTHTHCAVCLGPCALRHSVSRSFSLGGCEGCVACLIVYWLGMVRAG